VVEAGAHQGDLKDLAGVSGALPVVDANMLKSLLWASQHYVAPVSVLLAKASPPNLPKTMVEPPTSAVGTQESSHPLAALTEAAAAGRRRPTHAILGRWQDLDWIHSLAPVLAAGRSVIVTAATAAEVDRVAAVARDAFGDRVLAVAGEGDAEITAQWERAQSSGRLIVGTPRVALWRVEGLSLALVLEEGRRAMKDRQTPTLHVREVLRTRSRLEGFTTAFLGPTPSVEVLAAGAEVLRCGNRAWPHVEIIDRSDEAPGSGLLSSAVVAALRAISEAGERSFVLTGRRTLESVTAEANARLGRPAVGAGGPVLVGGERDLAGLDPVALTVAVNAEGMLMGSGYRASEEALRQLARLANSLKRGPGHRMMVQTFDPGSSLVETLRRGDPIPYLENVLVERAKGGVPPSIEMIAVEIRGEQPLRVDEELRVLSDVAVMGPLDIERGRRWLLEGDLGKARTELRRLIGRWRSSETVVRVDADPIDL
jgi:primosomal protein N'